MVFAIFGFCCVLFQLNAVSMHIFCKVFITNKRPNILFLFQFQTLNDRDYEAIVQYLICTSVGMGLLVAFCLYGSMTTQRFESLNEFVYQLDWYRYPINVQKSLLLVIAMTNEEIYIESYFSTQCTRAKLQAVCVLLKQKFRIAINCLISILFRR